MSRKSDQVPACPKCEEEIDTIHTSQSIEIVRKENGTWERDILDLMDTFHCSNCNEELSVDDLDNLKVPNEVR